MTVEPLPEKQTSLKRMFAWTSTLCVLLVLVQWALNAGETENNTDALIYYMVGDSLVRFGIVFAPFIGLALFVAMLVAQMKASRMMLSSALFLGLVLAVIHVNMPLDQRLWQANHRLLFATALAAVLCIAESFRPQYSRQHRVIAFLAVGAVVCYFLHIAALVVASSA